MATIIPRPAPSGLQQQFMAQAAARHAAHRSSRHKSLQDEADRIHLGVEAARQLANAKMIDSMLLRPTFVRHEKPPAPLLATISRPTHALPLYLTALFVAQCLGTPGTAFTNNIGIITKTTGSSTTWARLVGAYGGGLRRRACRARVTRALDALEGHGLIQIGPRSTRNRYEHFGLLKEDGSDGTYKVPGRERADMMNRIPIELFTNGWHLVLKPKELAMLLIVIDGHRRYNHDGNGIRLPEETKERYPLSGETYSAIHELAEFGLIDIRDAMPNRRGGKVRDRAVSDHDPRDTDDPGEGGIDPDESSRDPVPYNLILPDDLPDRLRRSAYDVVTATLTANATPPRFGEHYPQLDDV